MRSVGLVVLMLTLAPLPASADAIGGPRDDCPPGTRPSMAGHGSWLCSPRDCQPGSTCGGGVDGTIGVFGAPPPGPSECREVALCITTTTISRGMPNGRDLGPAPTAQTVVGECGEGDTCEQGECSRAFRCVETEDEPEPEEDEVVAEPEPEQPADEGAPEAAEANDEGGCGCSAPGRSGGGSAAWILGALALLLGRGFSAGRRRDP